jgi:hypothetical protein
MLQKLDIWNQISEKVMHCVRSFIRDCYIHFIFAEYVPVWRIVLCRLKEEP